MQQRLSFFFALRAREGLRRHEVSVGVVGMGREQVLELAECSVGLARARVLQPKGVTRKSIVGVCVQYLFQRRHAGFVGHYAISSLERMLLEQPSNAQTRLRSSRRVGALVGSG